MKVGQTKVKVLKREVNEQTGKETIREIHRGVVVELGSSFARVYNPAPVNEGGDASQLTAELFPIAGKNCWIAPAGELEAPLRLAPELR